MAVPANLPDFNADIAKMFIESSGGTKGLQGFLGIRIVEVTPGYLRAELDVKDDLLTPIGNMHGGVISAFCDHVLGCVCYPHMGKGWWAATTEFKVNLLAPVSKGTVTAEAHIINMTKSTAVVRIDVSNEGRNCAAAQGTVTVRAPKKA